MLKKGVQRTAGEGRMCARRVAAQRSYVLLHKGHGTAFSTVLKA